jgi:hypothetical protein
MAESQLLPRRISHYTTIQGMMGILTSNCLWASNASFLNDRKELSHALDVAQAAIEKLTSSRAMRHWAPMLKRAVNDLNGGEIPDTYVTCFCVNDDNLSQWRGYGGNQQGISITFDRLKLSRRLKSENAKLYKVIYAKITTRDKLREALKGELADIADLKDVLGENSPEEQYNDIFGRLCSLLPKFKHLGFKDEREWRFVVQKSIKVEDLCFRAGRNRIVPYIELGKAEQLLPIISIRVGPGDDQELTALSISQLLKAKGHIGVKIDISDIPFRN